LENVILKLTSVVLTVSLAAASGASARAQNAERGTADAMPIGDNSVVTRVEVPEDALAKRIQTGRFDLSL